MYLDIYTLLTILVAGGIASAQEEQSTSPPSSATSNTTSSATSASGLPSASASPLPSDIAKITWPKKDTWWVIGGTQYLAWEYNHHITPEPYTQQFLRNTENSSAINMTAYTADRMRPDWRFWNGTHTYTAKCYNFQHWEPISFESSAVYPFLRTTNCTRETCRHPPVFPSKGYQIGLAWSSNITSKDRSSYDNTWSIVWSEKFEIRDEGPETFPPGVEPIRDWLWTESSSAISGKSADTALHFTQAVAGVFAAILMAV